MYMCYFILFYMNFHEVAFIDLNRLKYQVLFHTRSGVAVEVLNVTVATRFYGSEWLLPLITTMKGAQTIL